MNSLSKTFSLISLAVASSSAQSLYGYGGYPSYPYCSRYNYYPSNSYPSYYPQKSYYPYNDYYNYPQQNTYQGNYYTQPYNYPQQYNNYYTPQQSNYPNNNYPQQTTSQPQNIQGSMYGRNQNGSYASITPGSNGVNTLNYNQYANNLLTSSETQNNAYGQESQNQGLQQSNTASTSYTPGLYGGIANYQNQQNSDTQFYQQFSYSGNGNNVGSGSSMGSSFYPNY